MKTSLPHCLLILALAAMPATAQQPNEKAARYLEPLLKRPGSGPLFERFVDAWLDSDTLENLQKYLGAKVQAGDTTANRLLFAVFLSRQGETVKALEQFRAALAKEPGSADIWYQKAAVEARTLDFDSAIASLRKAREAKPAAGLALQTGQLLGRLLARSGRTDEALKVWQELMVSRPDDEELREDVLELQIAEGLHTAAQATAEALVAEAKDPYKKILFRLRLGDVHDRAGARDKALETYASCLADAGADSWLEKEIGAQLEKLFRREDDLAGLKTFYTKLLEKEPQRLSLRRAQAKLLVEMGDTEAAVAAGRELLKLAPGDRSVREEFILLLAGAQKLPEAIAQLEELRKQTPNDAELLLRLATLQNDAGKKKEAAALVREFVKLSGDEASRLRASGLLERCGMADEAADVLRESDAPALRQSLASVLHKNGKKDEALAEWRKLASGNVTAVLEAARAMSAHGEIEAAWLLLKENADKAENDAAFLTALCQAAERTDHAPEALPFVRKLVSRATLSTDVEAALDLAVKLTRKADKVDEMTAELKNAATGQDFALLAALREEARDSAGAEAALRKAEAASPEIAAALLVRLYSQRADYMQAALALERLFNSAGGRKAHHAQSLTDLWVRAGSLEKALKAARDWRQLAPGSTAPVLAEARLLESSGKDAEALEVLRRAAGQFEGNEDIRSQLADAYRDSGRMADALRIYSSLYENAAELSAKMRWLQEWAQTAELAGRTQELVEQFEERRRASRDSIVPLLALAEIHRAANNYDSRRKALTEAARLKPNDPELALEIARLEAREDNNDAAIRTLRAALQHDKNGTVRQDLVLLLLRSGERDEGLRMLSEGQADALKDPAVVEGVTEGLMTRDTAETALKFLMPHLAVHPDDYRLHLLAAQLESEEKPEPAKARLLRVLSQRKELPDARLKAFQGPTAARGFDEEEFMNMLSAVLTPQASEFMAFAIKSRDSMRNRGRNRQNQSPALPENLEDAHATAAALLLSDDRFAAGDDKEALLTEMEHAGFGAARVIRDTGSNSMMDIFQNASELREASAAKPENETLLALAALAQMMDWDEEADAELAARAWAKFGKERTPLGLLGALPAVGGDPPAAWEEEALRAAEAIEKPDEVLLIAAIRATGSPYGDDEEKREISPGVQKRLNALLQRWYMGTDFRSQMMTQMGSMIFLTLANGFQKAHDAEGFAKLLDEEAGRGAGQSQANPFTMMYGGRQRGVAQPLGFPPRSASLGISGIVASLLEAGDDDNDYINKGDMSPETLRKTAELVKNPVVKLLLLVRAGDDEAAGKLIEGRLTAQEPDAASYLLAAAWAEKQGDFAKAAEVARKGLFLPLSRESRKSLDAAFLSWAESDKASEPVQAAAREAALRMRRDMLTPEARQQLIAVMDGLGLTNEAEKLARQDANASPGAGGGVALGSISSSMPSQAVLTPSGKLLATGKKDEALPLLTKELLAYGREALKPAGWGGVRGFDEWYSTLKQFAMVPAVMKSVVPAEGDVKALALHGAILDLAGEAKEATAAFKKAVAAGSTEPGVKYRLFRLIAATEPKEAAKLLGDLPADARGTAFSALASTRNNSYYGRAMMGAVAGRYSGGRRIYYPGSDDDGTRLPLATALAAAEVLETYLAAAKTEDLAGADWLADALGSVAQVAALEKGWVAPSLYTAKWATPVTSREYAESQPNAQLASGPDQTPELSDEAGAVKKVKLRAEMFDRIVDKLLSTPGTACLAWQAMKQRQTFDDKEPMPAKVFDAGMAAALLDIGAQKPNNRAAAEEQRWHTVFYTLMPAALRTGRLADVETKLLPEVRKAAKGKGLEVIERDWALHRCPPDEFVARAKEAVAKSRGTAWSMVFQTAGIRRTGVELTGELITWMEPKLKANQDVREAAGALPLAAQLLHDLKGSETVDQWLRGAWERVTGTREERAKLLATMDEDGDISGRKGQTLQWMTWLTSQIRETPALVFLALRIQEQEYEAFVPKKAAANNSYDQSENRQSWMVSATSHLKELLKAGKIKEASEWLRESPFLGSAGDFRTAGGLYPMVADALSLTQRPVLLQLGFMESAGKQTFGQALLSAAVERNRSRDVCNVMARWQKDIESLPQKRRDELLGVLRQWSELEDSAPEGLTKEGRAFRKWLEKAGDEEKLAGVDGEVNEFLDPKNLREMRTSGNWEFENKLREVLELLIKAESPRLREVVEKVRETAQQAGRTPDKNTLGESLERILSQSSNDAKTLCLTVGLTLHALAAPGPGAMPLNWSLVEEVADSGDDMGRMQRDPVARMKMIADALAPHVSEDRTVLLAPLFWAAIEVRANTDDAPTVEENCGLILQWAAGAGKKHARQDLVQAIADCAKMVQLSYEDIEGRKFRGVAAAGELPPAQQAYLAAMRDEKRSLAVRLTVACMILRQDAWQVEDLMLQEAVSLLEQAVKAKVPVPAWQETMIMEALNLREEAASKALVTRLLPILKSGRGMGSESDDVTRRGVKATLRAALRTGSMEVANRILRASGDQCDSQFLAIVAQYGTAEQMRNLLRPGRPGLFTEQETEGAGNEPWQDDLAQKLDAALAQVEQEDLRYLARLAVNALTYETDGEQEAEPGPRLAALAREFDKVKFREVALRERALEILADEPESATVVSGAIRASLEGLGISTIMSLRDDDAKRRKTKMFFAALSCSTAEGDFSMLEHAVTELLAPPKPERGESTSDLAGQCMAAAAGGLTADWKKKPEALVKACAFYRKVCGNPDFSGKVQTWQQTVQFTTLLHALANRMDELDAWWEKLSPDNRTRMEEGLSQTSIEDIFELGGRSYYSGSSYVEIPSYSMPQFFEDEDEDHTDPASSKLRDEVFLRFISSPLSGGQINGVADFTNAGWGEMEDALRLEEQWCAASPKGGMTAQRFAGLHNQSKDYARELAAAERGLKAARPARNGIGFNLVSWKVDALYHLARSTEGTELFLKIAKLPAERFDDAQIQKDADDAWENCVSLALEGPAEQTGSLADTIKVAAAVYGSLNEKAEFWGNLEAAGVLAGEFLSKEKRMEEAQAAAAFALKARAMCGKTGGETGLDWKVRAEAVLSGAAPGAPFLTEEAVWHWQEESSGAGEGWRMAGFDDGKWKSGAGPFGFGDEGLKTEISNKAADGEVLISWPFRAEFEVADPAAVRVLTLNLRADDGAIVWVNGKEAGRRNLPEGEIDHQTLAPKPINQVDEGKLDPLTLDPKLLVKGKNCVAVQLHQQRPDSSDAAFHAALLQSTDTGSPAADPDKAIQSLAPQLKDWPAGLKKVFLP